MLSNQAVVIVDNMNVIDTSDEGPWNGCFPRGFVEAVESGGFVLDEPSEDAFRNEGVPFNSTDDPDFGIKSRTVDEILDELRGSDALDALQ